MSAGFTPGRWRIDGQCAPDSPPALVISTQDTVIAEVYGENDAEEARADANLIAAAPSLYEALSAIGSQAICYGMAADKTELRDWLKSISETAEAALAQARGEA